MDRPSFKEGGLLRVLMRADGGPRIGTGHVMRSLAIAEELRAKGCSVQYACCEGTPTIAITRRGFSVVWVDGSAGSLKAAINSASIDVVFFDCPEIEDDEFIEAAENCCVGCMGYGDLYDGLTPDVIVSYIPSTNAAMYRSVFGSRGAKVLLGSQFVPLRREFGSVTQKHTPVKVVKTLVLGGGTDEHNVCGMILSVMKDDERWLNIEKHVVVGNAFVHKAELMDSYSGDAGVFFYEDVDDMASLMIQMDYAITAAGFTVNELAACKVPMTAYAVSDEQVRDGRYPGVMKWAGDLRNAAGDISEERVRALCADSLAVMGDYRLRTKMQEASTSLGFDGLGAVRIADELIDSAKKRYR